jgi:SAM-dependent methyltransferase
MRLHLYGTSPYLPDAGYLSADELSHQSGGNTGNLMFCHAIARMTGAGPQSIPWGASLDGLDPLADLLVLPLANQLGAHVDLDALADKMMRPKIPMVGLGLGAQGPIGGVDAAAIPQGTWKWLRVILERSVDGKPNVALRGEETLRVIEAQGLAEGCIVTGCPSNFINPSATLGREISRRRANAVKRIAVPAGNPFLSQHSLLEQSLRGLVESTNGTYVCQHPIDMLRLAKLEYNTIERSIFSRYRSYIHPEIDDDSFLSWFRSHAYAYASVPEWIAMMARHDMVVGTRIHGVMAGIQAGVPSVCLCIDSRTKELCQTMAIPYADANDYRDGIGIDDVQEILDGWDGRQYDDNRRVLGHRLANFLRDNRIEPRGALQTLLGTRVSGNRKDGLAAIEGSHQPSTTSSAGRYQAIFSAAALAVDVVNPSVLSFGCADGYELNDLATKHFHHGRVVGCDIDLDAQRIAALCNAQPARVKIIGADPAHLAEHGPYDVIVAMAVLCRWPETRCIENISEYYPFSRFEEQLRQFIELLVPGGVLCVYNSNYRVVDSSLMAQLEVITNPELIPTSQPVRLFHPSGQPRTDHVADGFLFRKVPRSGAGTRAL